MQFVFGTLQIIKMMITYISREAAKLGMSERFAICKDNRPLFIFYFLHHSCSTIHH